MDKLDHLGWVVSHYYEIGGMRAGIRTTSEAFGEMLDDILSDYRTEPSDGTPYYGIVVADRAKRGRDKRFHLFYKGAQAVVRTLDLPTLVRAVLSELESYLFPEREDAIYTDAALVRSNGTAALVPTALVSSLWKLGRRVDRAGLELPAELYVAVDPDSGQLVPIEPMLRIPGGSADALAALGSGSGRADPAALDRPSRVDVVCSFGAMEESFEPMSRGVILSTLASNVVNLETLGVRALEGLAQLVEGARCYGIQAAQPRPLLDTVVAALRAP